MIRTLLAMLLLPAAFALAPMAVSAQSSNDFDCEVEERQVQIKYSLYFENYRAENFEAALPDLEWLLACAPGFNGRNGDARNFRRAVEIHEGLAEGASDATERAEHLNRALELIETAVPTLMDAGVEVSEHEWLIRKGHFLQTYEADFPDRLNQACGAYTEAFELDAEATDDFYLQVIAFCRAEAAADGSADEKREARTYIEETIIPHIEAENVLEYAAGQAERLITTPREQFGFLYERYQEEGLDALTPDEIEQVFTLNQQAGTDLIGAEASAQLRSELLPVVAELSPSYSRFTSIANAELAERNFDQAIAFFERAIDIAEEPNQRRDTYYAIAMVKQQQNQFQSAANYLREALAIDRNHGNSLYLMGSLIQSSIPRGSTDTRVRAAYWCAADFFSRSAAQGTSNASSAAAAANRAGPSPEDYIFIGWRPGQTISASYGWGSCQTTVRG